MLGISFALPGLNMVELSCSARLLYTSLYGNSFLSKAEFYEDLWYNTEQRRVKEFYNLSDNLFEMFWNPLLHFTLQLPDILKLASFYYWLAALCVCELYLNSTVKCNKEPSGNYTYLKTNKQNMY